LSLFFVFWSEVPFWSLCEALLHIGMLVEEVFCLGCHLARTVQKVVCVVSCIGLGVGVGFGLDNPWSLWLFLGISKSQCIRTIIGV